MLDFYFDKEKLGLSDDPIEENYIGSMDFDDFKTLRKVPAYADELGISFHYYKDMEWSVDEVKALLTYCEESVSSNPDGKGGIHRFIKLLSEAYENDFGILMYCD